jgi:hypothetical protein
MLRETYSQAPECTVGHVQRVHTSEFVSPEREDGGDRVMGEMCAMIKDHDITLYHLQNKHDADDDGDWTKRVCADSKSNDDADTGGQGKNISRGRVPFRLLCASGWLPDARQDSGLPLGLSHAAAL